jgi:hypothetical protein
MPNKIPLIIDLTDRDRDKKNKRRKYSKGLRSMQSSEVALSRAANRLASAVADGISEYRRRRDRDSLKRRDGLILSYLPSLGRGVSRVVREASDVPYDLSRAIDHREFRNALRCFNRSMRDFKYPRD